MRHQPLTPTLLLATLVAPQIRCHSAQQLRAITEATFPLDELFASDDDFAILRRAPQPRLTKKSFVLCDGPLVTPEIVLPRGAIEAFSENVLATSSIAIPEPYTAHDGDTRKLLDSRAFALVGSTSCVSAGSVEDPAPVQAAPRRHRKDNHRKPPLEFVVGVPLSCCRGSGNGLVTPLAEQEMRESHRLRMRLKERIVAQAHRDETRPGKFVLLDDRVLAASRRLGLGKIDLRVVSAPKQRPTQRGRTKASGASSSTPDAHEVSDAIENQLASIDQNRSRYLGYIQRRYIDHFANAQEILQRALTELWRYQERRGWVHPNSKALFRKILRCSVQNHHRVQNRKGRGGLSSLTHAVDVSCPQPGPLETCAREEISRLLEDAVTALPEAQCEAITLCHLQSKTRRVVAKQLGIPVGTLGGRLRAAKEALRTALERFAGQDTA